MNADWLFTTPAVVIQLVSGIWLTARLGIPFESDWFFAVISLFVFVGICRVPVVRIQIRIRNLISTGARRDAFEGLMKVWLALGIPAFLSVLILFYLMVSKAGAHT